MNNGTKRYSTSSGDGASTSKKVKIEDDSDYDIEGNQSESSFYEGSTVSEKNLTRYLVTLEDDDEATITFKSDSMQFDSPDEYTDVKEDDMESSCEFEELQQFSPFVERDTSDDETTSESTTEDLRYLIELNEQGLIIDFNLNDSNEREESTEVDLLDPEDVIEHSVNNMFNIFSRLPGQSLNIQGEIAHIGPPQFFQVLESVSSVLELILSDSNNIQVGAVYSFKQVSVTASTPNEDIFKYDLILDSNTVIREITNKELTALESQYDLTNYAKIILKSAGQFVGE
ncbi:hypothetical protein QAD02_021203 [Eretmocerus hayati]|uniref:Uncharacterized protein n=1 Tax=Eretmocerus hayati TaxID=131215 RepID=A0ACC2PUE2_9HYME|nr:hypothetical protein QAD02_021203 [Eretmocerus hayati]